MTSKEEAMQTRRPHPYSLSLKGVGRLALLCLLLAAPAVAQESESRELESKTDARHFDECRNSPDIGGRADACASLWRKGKLTKEEVTPALREALRYADRDVNRRAAYVFANMGDGSEDVVRLLAEGLKDADEHVREESVKALGNVREGAERVVPHLIEALKDRDDARSALTSLGRAAEGATVPRLGEALRDPNEDVRWRAAYVLGALGVGAKAAVPQLTEALKDPDKRVRLGVTYALGGAESAAKEAVPGLVEALNDHVEGVCSNAADALETISKTLVSERATEYIGSLDAAAEAMRNSPYPGVKRHAEDVRQRSEHLRLLWWERLNRWVVAHPVLGLAVGVYPALLLAWVVLLWLRPLWLLHVNEALANTVDVKLPERLGGFNVSPRHLTLVGLFHYHSRVMDAWVAKHIGAAREMFSGLPTVEERKIYVPLPVVIRNEAEADLSTDKLRQILSRKIICMLLWGEGGSGKTSLACRLAQWAMSSRKEARLNEEHQMLPVLIEQDLVVQDKDPEHPLLRAVRHQVRVMINEDDPPPAGLLRRLLKKRRVLVIVDGFSEMTEASRAAVVEGITDLPVNAVIITTRADEQLGVIPKTEIRPLRVKGNRLATFMEAYLSARGRRELFEDDEFFEVCRRLSLIVGDRDITALLAKLYAEQMMALKNGAADGDAPGNIPELMLSYVNDLCRAAGHDDPDIRAVHRAVKSIAWECLKKTLRPMPARREDVLTALGGEEKGEPILKYLDRRLRVVQTVGAGRDRVRFGLDPLAEYMAGMHLMDVNGEDEQAWLDFLTRVDESGGAPEDVKGFLLAVRDCCLARGEDVRCLRTVADELAKRAGVSPDESRRYKIERRVRQLIARLKYSEDKDRSNAAEELGLIGAPAKIAVKDLCVLLSDQDVDVRLSAARALGRIGQEVGEAVVPHLLEVLKESDEDARDSAAYAPLRRGVKERG